MLRSRLRLRIGEGAEKEFKKPIAQPTKNTARVNETKLYA
jgi:hypothetical protein